MVPNNKGVYHLKGGIHKYLEEFGTSKDGCKFIGKNFVFDRRGAMSGADCLDGEQKSESGEKVVGQCMYCDRAHDTFLPENVCTVCREPVLVCPECVDGLKTKQLELRGLNDNQNMRVEFHCEDHFQTKTCYYTSLHGFSVDELNRQIQQLQLHSKQFEGIGKKGKQKRRTIRKQIEKIEAYMNSIKTGEGMEVESELQCRNCGSTACSGDCWGFHGGNTRMINKEKAESVAASEMSSSCLANKRQKERTRTPSNQRPGKRLKREQELSEVDKLQLCKQASEYRLPNGLRVPPPSVRVLRSSVKGKWCGRTLQSVMTTEFHEFAGKDGGVRLNQIISADLLRINGIPVSKLAADSNQNANDLLLKNMDTLERVVHWHEPPVSIPEHIPLTKHQIPDTVLASRSTTSNIDSSTSPSLYCINKPSSVPVHPAGPYYANSLTLMVEAQEALTPKSLIPCHRIDRCTSGVLLCTDDINVPRTVQGAMTSSESDVIKKLYVARVKGKFPDSGDKIEPCADFYTWHGNTLEVNAPISVQLSGRGNSDGAGEASNMMHRVISSDGKQSISRFKLISYDPKTNQSLVSCCPITGRGHQLRVHLHFIGHPIHNDSEYGGELDADSVKEREIQSVQSMVDVKTSSCLRDESVSHYEAKSAVDMCKCCSNGEQGVRASFQSAQLLGEGHAIDLHAYKYSIRFKHKGANGNDSTEMEFSTGLPSWASEFEDTIPLCIDWLK